MVVQTDGDPVMGMNLPKEATHVQFSMTFMYVRLATACIVGSIVTTSHGRALVVQEMWAQLLMC